MASAPRGMKRHPRYPDVRLFQAPNGKSQNWYAGFHHGGKFRRQSMGTTDFAAAIKKAETWFEDRRYEIRNDKYVPPGGTPFSRLVEPTLAMMATEKKAARYVAVTKTYLAKDGYLHRFFGKLKIERITSDTWDEYRLWLSTTRESEGKPLHSERSLHQMKNVVHLVLKCARRKKLIPARVRFEDQFRQPKLDARPRTHFNWEEGMALRSAVQKNAAAHLAKGTRWINDSEELHDFVEFVWQTGLRVGEARALRVRDVNVVMDDVSFGGSPVRAEICEVTIVGGKRGAHPTCKSTHFAVAPFRRILKRRGISDPSICEEPLFLKHHRDAFRRILKDHGLHIDGYGRRRDFVSLRHTYICERLVDGANVWDVARNTRTSVTMIENHYAKTLPLSGLAINTSKPIPWPRYG